MLHSDTHLQAGSAFKRKVNAYNDLTASCSSSLNVSRYHDDFAFLLVEWISFFVLFTCSCSHFVEVTTATTMHGGFSHTSDHPPHIVHMNIMLVKRKQHHSNDDHNPVMACTLSHVHNAEGASVLIGAETRLKCALTMEQTMVQQAVFFYI